MKLISYASAILLATNLYAHVQPAAADTFASGGIVKGSNLYLAKWQCKDLARPRSGNVLDALLRTLGWRDSWQGFGFYLVKGSPSAPRTNATISTIDGLLAAQVVYIVDSDNASESLYNTSCSGQVVVKGTDIPNLVVFKGSATVTNDILSKISGFLTAVIPPLYHLVVGANLPDNTAGDLKDGKDALNAYSSNILPMFARSHAVTEPHPLRLGRYLLHSPFADVTITVTKPESLLLSSAPFKSSVDSFLSPKVTLSEADLEINKLANIRNKCNSVVQEWSPAGLTSNIDKAYVMYHRMSLLSPTREAIIKCLGRTYAYAAIPYLGAKYFDLPEDWKFSSNDIESYVPGNQVVNEEFGIQPQGWDRLFSTMKFISERAGRELREKQESEFLSKFATRIRIEDETAQYKVLAELDPDNKGVSFEAATKDAFAKLRSLGFTKLGCISETDSASGSVFKSQRNEAVIILAYKSSNNEPLTAEKARAIRVLFEGKLIRSLVFTDYFDINSYVSTVCPARAH